MIDELEIAFMSFCASYTDIMELDTKKKVEEENLILGKVA